MIVRLKCASDISPTLKREHAVHERSVGYEAVRISGIIFSQDGEVELVMPAADSGSLFVGDAALFDVVDATLHKDWIYSGARPENGIASMVSLPALAESNALDLVLGMSPTAQRAFYRIHSW